MEKEALEKRIKYVTSEFAWRVIRNQVDISSKKEEERGSFNFIPIELYRIIADFILLREALEQDRRWSGYCKKNTKFLDAGCGIGNVLLMATVTNICYEAHGLELFPKTFTKAKRWLGNSCITDPHRRTDSGFNMPRIVLLKRDILTFRDYKNYDVIYYYRPFKDGTKENKFESKVENDMSVGSVLIPKLKYTELDHDKRFKVVRHPNCRMSEPAFIKIKN